MTCHSHPFGDPMGLACLRTDEHRTGHVYAAREPGDTHYEPAESEH